MLVMVGALIVLPSYYFFYTPPTCTDKVKNGTEQGIDCGGSCTKLCSSSFLPVPAPTWVRMREMAPNTYNVAAYIINPNPRAASMPIAYRMDLIDAQGFTIASGFGKVAIPPGRNTLAFNTIRNTANKPPARAVFNLTGDADWYLAADNLSALEVVNKDYIENETGSSLEVTLRNLSAMPIKNVVVYAVLKDKDDTVLDFSRTIVDRVAPMNTEIAPFTWPDSHDGKVISIEVLPVAE